MSVVTKAADLKSQKFVAVKKMLPGGDVRLKQESINRESRALEVLRHPNIVTLIDGGKAEDGSAYLVLEWLESSLDEFIANRGPLRWADYYPTIGRPLLSAVAFAHRKEWIHRDIKPKNILLAEDGTPKLTDYGIAKLESNPRLGVTFGDFRSEPYTPQEYDDGRYSYARDCFSLAAVTVFCLSGKPLTSYVELYAHLADLDPATTPRSILEAALSQDPALRPQLASQLLADFEQFERARKRNERPDLEIFISFSPEVVEATGRQVGQHQSRREIDEYLIGELNEGATVSVVEGAGGLTFRLHGVTWVFEGARTKEGAPGILIEKAYRMWASELERVRQGASEIGAVFTYEPPTNWAEAARVLDEMTARIALDLQEKDKAAQRQQGEQIFRGWYSLLRARLEYEIKRQAAVHYELLEREGMRAIVRTAQPLPEEAIGQSRLIRTQSDRFVLCDVIDVRFDEVTIAVTHGSSDEIPRRGEIEVNTYAEEKALERQRQAVDSVYYDRAAASSLKQLIAFPHLSDVPIPTKALPLPVGDKFGNDKLGVLEKALAVQDVLVVKGPPGTGKTRLIEELILQYLAKFPEHRILLSSQTHIALDNVLERVIDRVPELDVIRIGRTDDPRISEVCRPLLLEYKVESWARKARGAAEEFLRKWASEQGLNKEEADTAILAERLVKTVEIRRSLEVQRAELERTEAGISDKRQRQVEETGSGESKTLDRDSEQVATQLADLSATIAKSRSAELEIRERLKGISEYGSELHDKNIEEVREWIDVLLSAGPTESRYRELLNLQEEWMVRIGKTSDFFAATLSTARIVAGTCIGLAGVRGFSEVSYDLCILDEASKATATEALVPMSRARRWVLVGDPEQLPPFLDSEFARGFEEMKEQEIRETLLDRFSRLLPKGAIEELTIQHRMLRPIGDLISECFYNKNLTSVREKPDVSLASLYRCPVTWLSTSHIERRSERTAGQSFENPVECRIVRDVLARINFILSRKKQRCKVAVMAGYVAQVKALREAIRDHVHRWGNLDVVCNTVDSFQGQQADICLYSVTRSNPNGRLGFLREKPRLNVALSRARDVLLIVGDSEFCRSAEGDNPFRKVVQYMEDHQDTCEVKPTDAT